MMTLFSRYSLSTLFAGFIVLQIPIALFLAHIAGNSLLLVGIGATAFACVAVIGALFFDKRVNGYVIGLTYMSMTALQVTALTGNPMQVDMHLFFMAGLALLASFRSQRVILASAGAVAVHHAIFNFAAPDLVYPGGTNIIRLVLHATVLCVETVGLTMIINGINQRSAEVELRAQEAASARKQAEEEAMALTVTLQELEEAREASDRANAHRIELEAERQRYADEQAEVVSSLATGLKTLASGDLTYRLQTVFADRYEGLRTDFNNAVSSLEGVLLRLLASSGNIRITTTEINRATDDLSIRTERQATTLEETAVALDQLTVTVRQSADGANEANRVVASAREEAKKSGEVVRSAVNAMDAISESATQIGRITTVIDEIAFQTNLLALNAGVEAARAGDAGRGFAVVATEVRALAQRSAEAAKEIDGFIRASTRQVKSGVGLVGQAGDTLQQIAENVEQISSMVSEIAHASQEQATGLTQINTAVNQMDQVTQQNAAMVEQTSAASHNLAGEAEELAILLGNFKLGRDADARHQQNDDNHFHGEDDWLRQRIGSRMVGS